MNNVMVRGTLFIMSITVLYIMAGCSKVTTSSLISTNTPNNTSIPHQSSTKQVPIIQTPAPTILPSIMPSATWTPLPTLAADQAQNSISSLVLSNGGCQIPCWWGIIPNKTKWYEARQFLAPFSEIKQGGSGSFYENGIEHYTTNYGVYYGIPDKNTLGRLILSVQDDIVIGITVYPPVSEYNFQLHQILTLFGTPNQIYISAQPETQTDELLPATVILDYSNVGVIASYEFAPYKAGENLIICPDSAGARLELQDPNIIYSNALSIEEYVTMITGFDPKKLADISAMNIESFYETFRDSKVTTCVETPINIWP